MTWKKGQPGNPSGRPKGARNLLSESVLKELISHYRSPKLEVGVGGGGALLGRE